MAELKQMMFGISTDSDGRIILLVSVLTSVTQEQHRAAVKYGIVHHPTEGEMLSDDGSATIVCSCGARWRIGAAKLSNDEVRGTFNSHLSYFTKPKTVTL